VILEMLANVNLGKDLEVLPWAARGRDRSRGTVGDRSRPRWREASILGMS